MWLMELVLSFPRKSEQEECSLSCFRKPIPHRLRTPAHFTPFFLDTHKTGTKHQDGRVAPPRPIGNTIPPRRTCITFASSASSSRPVVFPYATKPTGASTRHTNKAAAMREPEPYDHLFKLLLIGDAGVGKSRYVKGGGGERGRWAGAC